MRHASSPRHVVARISSTSGRDGLKQACAASQEHHRAITPGIG
jgi:hypothetical protein